MIESSRIILVEYVGHMGNMRNANKVLLGKQTEETIGRPSLRWDDNIKMDIKYVMRMQSVFIYLRTGTSFWLLQTW